MKNKILKIILFIFMFSVSTQIVFADNHTTTTLKATTNTEDVDFKPSSYELISPIGNLSKIDDQDKEGFSGFVNLIIVIAIALAGAIAVIIIIISGIQYMGNDSVWQKGQSKIKISSAVGGIILLLCSYIILNTINPDLVNIRIGGSQKISEGEWEFYTPTQGRVVSNNDLGPGKLPAGIYCPKTKGNFNEVEKIARSFSGNTTYRFGGKIYNQAPYGYPKNNKEYDSYCPKGQVCLDCSGFADTLLSCAGLKTPTNSDTGSRAISGDTEVVQKNTFIKNGSTISVNGTPLRSGDVLTWSSHVYVYIGNGFFADSHAGGGGREPGKAIGIFTFEDLKKAGYISKTTHIIRVVSQ